jgi:transposase-like protein
MMTQRTIWGFEVETSPKGKNIWPYDLKREVVRRILDEDQHIGTIAAEIGAHECLVRKWCVAARRERGETVVAPKPTFSKISISTEEIAPVNVQSSLSRASLTIGEVEVSFPAHISYEQLSRLFEAARSIK